MAIETIENPNYRRMLRPQCFADRVAYLDFMIDYYFRAMVALGPVGFKSEFRAQMSTTLQMMFTKGKSMRSLLDGFSHSNYGKKLSCSADHTILFTLVRTAYEQLCAFELVYLIPDTDDKRTILKNAYVAAGQVNRLKMFTEDGLARYFEEVDMARRDIEECRQEICNTQQFQSLSEKAQGVLLETIFKKGEFQIVFTEDGKMKPHVGWDEVRDYCRLSTDTLHGMYKYACNMAHPSYLGLIQFHDAYKEGAIMSLNETAIIQMISVMSVFLMDFLKAFPEVAHVYKDADEETKFMVRMYSESFRNSSNIEK
jgi:hypothetical protein